MIKISAGIAYELNRPTTFASALDAQVGEKCLKKALYKKKFDKSCDKSQYATFGANFFFDHLMGLASALIAQFVFFFFFFFGGGGQKVP